MLGSQDFWEFWCHKKDGIQKNLVTPNSGIPRIVGSQIFWDEQTNERSLVSQSLVSQSLNQLAIDQLPIDQGIQALLRSLEI